MNAQEFEAAVGRPPELDDLERANCQDAGKPAHTGCGVCEHGVPVFLCFDDAGGCFAKALNGSVRYQYQCHTDPKS